MGVLLRFFNLTQPTMKVLLFVALAIAAVVAEPEAEATAAANPDADAAADAWHGYYGYGRRWGGYYGGYYGHPYGYGYYRNKRSPAPEAEASPVAKPEAEAYDPKVEAEARTAAWYGYYGQRYNGYGQSYCPKFYRNCYGYGYYNHSG